MPDNVNEPESIAARWLYSVLRSVPVRVYDPAVRVVVIAGGAAPAVMRILDNRII